MGKNSMEREKHERRRARRRPVLESFALAAQIPAIGPHRLKIEDLSELGIGFHIEPEVFGDGRVPDFVPGESVELKLFLNLSLFIPMQLKVARVEPQGESRHILVGGEFTGSSSGSLHAVASFLSMLDMLTDSVRLQPATRPQLSTGSAPKKAKKPANSPGKLRKKA